MKRRGDPKTFLSLRRVVLILLVGMVMTGCGSTKIVQFAEVPERRISAISKLPLSVAVVLPDTASQLQRIRQDPYWNVTVPTGMLLGSAARQIYPQVFENVQFFSAGDAPAGFDAVLAPVVDDFSYYVSVSNISIYSTMHFNAKISVKHSMLDRNGMLIWEKTISPEKYTSAKFTAQTVFGIEDRQLASVFAESAGDAVRESVKTLMRAPEIHAYASAIGKKSLTDAASSASSSAIIRSDVDELPAGKTRPTGNAYAIVIGIEHYRQKLPKADFATQDAKLVTEYLTKVLGYPDQNVITLTNDHASNVDLAKYFEKWLPNNFEQGGRLFVYYSGHGAPNPKTGDAYLVPFDGDPSFIDETGYSLKRMYAALGKLPAKEVIVALDSCFSGAGGRSVLAEGARPLVMNLQTSAAPSNNMTILSAASGEQISSTYKDKGHGLFTYFLLKGIKNEDVVKQDGTLDISSLYDYLKPQVSSIARKKYNNEQTPQLIGAANR